MFIKNQSHKRYYNIINIAMSRKIDGYTEKHHIIPKCMGGTNDKENIVKLTAREHFICHRLLTKMVDHPYKNKLAYASWQLGRSLKLKDIKITSRLYEQLKLELSESMKGRKRPEFSQEWKDNMSKSRKGKPSPKRGIPLSDKHKQKLSIIRKGKPHPCTFTEEYINGLSGHFSIIHKGRPKKKSLCSVCGMMVAPNMMSRFHGDNCRDRSYKPMIKSPCTICGEMVTDGIMKRWHGDNCNNKSRDRKCPVCGETVNRYNMKHYHGDNCGIIFPPDKIITCPHCGKTGNIGNMKRWHFVNCKSKK